jgi:hypothetical protein
MLAHTVAVCVKNVTTNECWVFLEFVHYLSVASREIRFRWPISVFLMILTHIVGVHIRI